MNSYRFLIVFISLFSLNLSSVAQHTRHSIKENSSLQLSSTAFQPGGNIPQKFSCEGNNISPALSWKGAPTAVKTFALVVHDPDAPHAGGYTHWVIYNIPANITQLAEGTPKDDRLPSGALQGKNDDGKTGYTGPCPPSGTHRYYFYLYALDSELDLQPGATAQDLDKAIEGHILAKTELMGHFKKLP
jgi:Raf kinase inhibitor-like YbhB/YbcL family protein